MMMMMMNEKSVKKEPTETMAKTEGTETMEKKEQAARKEPTEMKTTRGMSSPAKQGEVQVDDYLFIRSSPAQQGEDHQ